MLPKSFSPGKLQVCREGEGVMCYGFMEQPLPAHGIPLPLSRGGRTPALLRWGLLPGRAGCSSVHPA